MGQGDGSQGSKTPWGEKIEPKAFGAPEADAARGGSRARRLPLHSSGWSPVDR